MKLTKTDFDALLDNMFTFDDASLEVGQYVLMSDYVVRQIVLLRKTTMSEYVVDGPSVKTAITKIQYFPATTDQPRPLAVMPTDRFKDYPVDVLKSVWGVFVVLSQDDKVGVNIHGIHMDDFGKVVAALDPKLFGPTSQQYVPFDFEKTIAASPNIVECHGTDTPDRINFYENDYYCFSNFSSFQIRYVPNSFPTQQIIFPTSEHMYHWRRFILGYEETGNAKSAAIATAILDSRSAHDAFKIAQDNKQHQVSNWDLIKENEMYQIILLKHNQHEYVAQKLKASGSRRLSENSWRDGYWGSGADDIGLDKLGKLWMRLRMEQYGH